ncbi:Transcriptional activator protein DAL81 [Talaromyces islandicus]|uniref:Transcriptional activator protein DAL81 n=1 Tax=Talaromyces islandicus TaxID=28573 RepID=A0A0U1LYA5_TALIS|nr:Transcriptional activator protein DAL81 [Talaromyces islandicus]
MATAITIQATSSGPAPAGVPLTTADHRSLLRQHHRMSSTNSPVASLTNSPVTSSASFSAITTPTTKASLPPVVSSRGPSGRDGVSCDACLFRKSRCAMNELVNKCYSCDFHRQDCTFTLANSNNLPASLGSPQSKKRKLDELVVEPSSKRPSTDISRPVEPTKEMLPTTTCGGALTAPELSFQSGQHIGLTTELEPVLFEHLPLDDNDESVLSSSHKIRRFTEDGFFMRIMDNGAKETPTVSLDAIETLVAPYGSTLVDKFFQKIHPVYPILMEDSFRQSYRTRKGLSPLLLAAVYTLTLKYLEFEPAARTARKPDVKKMEDTAMKLLTESLPRADITAIQAGLLIMQRSSLNTSSLNGQLATAAFELGLHQDCSNWKIPAAEKGLRRRMAWALHTQDKWSSLVHGRPSHMSAANWTVRDLVPDDFIGAFPQTGSDDNNETPVLGHGPLLFCQHVSLTAILAEILDTFYTLRAAEQFSAAGINKTRHILERAKPVQIRLKDWFSRLPAEMKMESPSSGSEILFDEVTEESASNGALHVAYFATEITLHRCIVRSLSPETADNYLSHICRSAAKTRLISAMDFVNRLRPAHLQAFWPGSSRTNFALIGSFGTLLLATAPTREEAEFYRQRLAEYRWTLSVSVKNAQFLKHAIESLDMATLLAQNVPEKPGIEELMASVVAAKNSQRRRNGPTKIGGETHFAREMDAEIIMGEGGAGASSVVSGLASPATSLSDEDLSDDEAGEGY